MSVTGENCTEEFCSAYLRIFINNKLDYTSAVYGKTTTPRFKFTYMSKPIHEDSKVTIELWTYYLPVAVESLSPDDRMFRFPEDRVFHYMQSIKDPERRDMYRFMEPLGIDGISGRKFKTARFRSKKQEWVKNKKKLVVAYDDDEIERLVYKSALLSSWSFYSVRTLMYMNRLDGRIWDDHKQNIVFYNTTWIQHHCQQQEQQEQQQLPTAKPEKHMEEIAQPEPEPEPEKRDNIMETIISYTKPLISLTDRHLFRHTSQKIVKLVQEYTPNLYNETIGNE